MMYKAVLSLVGAATATQLSIITPDALKSSFPDNGNVQAHLGHFGHIEYGSNFNGRLHYPVSNRNGCSVFVASDFQNDQLFDEDTDMTPILLVEHGGCTHTEKVFNA